MDLQGKFVPWRSVASINPDSMPLLSGTQRWASRARLSIVLTEPLSHLEIRGGLFSGISLDHSGRTVFVSLERTAESPSVIFQLATDLWDRSRQRPHEPRPFSRPG